MTGNLGGSGAGRLRARSRSRHSGTKVLGECRPLSATAFASTHALAMAMPCSCASASLEKPIESMNLCERVRSARSIVMAT